MSMVDRFVCLSLSFLAALLVGFTQPAAAFEKFTAHGGPIKGIATSVDGRQLVSTSFDYTAVLWSLPDMAEKVQLVGHDAAVNTAAFSPDGRWLATGGDDNQILLWSLTDIRAGRPPVPQKLVGHTAKVVHLAFSPDSQLLASSSWDRSTGLWSVATGRSVGYLREHLSPVNASVFADSGRQIFTAGGDGHIRVWDVSRQKYLRSVVRNGFCINVMAIDEALDVLAFGSADGRMRSESLSGNGPAIDYVIDGAPVLSIAIDQAAERIAFGDSEGRILVADASIGEVDRDFRAVKGPVFSLQFAEQASQIVLAGLDDWVTRITFETFTPPDWMAIDGARRFHPDAELDNGASQFARKCSVCHSLDQSQKRRAGQTLFGVFGRKAGTLPGYPYSEALLTLDLVWSEHTIDALFRDGPDVVTPGSKMPVQRIKQQKDREDLIRFLRSVTMARTE